MTKSGKRSVAVRIAGHDYKIRSDVDEDWLRRVAEYVDRAMQRVREGTGTVDSVDVAVLTCLNLAREILTLREERNAVVDDDRLRSIIDKLESSLSASTADPATDDARLPLDAAARDEADAPFSPESSTDSPTKSGADGASSARTLDFDALRDRGGVSPDAESDSSASSAHDAVLSERRAAAGGRERAS